MKAKELMFGDWVYINEPSIKGNYQVQEVKRNDDMGITIGRYYFMWGDLIEPIPLTEEILKANGWNTYCEFGANFLATRLDWNLTIVNKKIGNTYLRIAGNWICDVNYVHELQHALRLCGLNDLADNFKIE